MADVLKFSGFAGATVVGGATGVDRPLRQVNVMQVPTARFAKRDELMLAAQAAVSGLQHELALLIDDLAERGVAALAVRRAGEDAVFDRAARKAADGVMLPLIELPTQAHLTDLQGQVLEHIIVQRAVQLRAAAQIRDGLAQHALADMPLQDLLEDIAALVQGSVAAFDHGGQMIAGTEEPNERLLSRVRTWLSQLRNDPVELSDTHILWPVLAGNRRLGCLVIGVGGVQDGLALAALEHGATIAAVQMMHLAEAAETSARLKSRFLRDLLSGVLDQTSARRRASTLGWNVHGSYHAMLIRPQVVDGLSVNQLVEEMASGPLIADHGDSCLALVPERTGISHSTLANRLLSHLPRIHVGLSSEHYGLESFPFAVNEARIALQAAEKFDRQKRVRRFDTLGALLLLVDLQSEELRSFATEVLQPLEELDIEYRSALRDTLELLIDTDLNVAEAARRGNWHYNTVRHRVKRLGELIGPFMEDGGVLDGVALALLIDRELGHNGGKQRTRKAPSTVDAVRA